MRLTKKMKWVLLDAWMDLQYITFPLVNGVRHTWASKASFCFSFKLLSFSGSGRVTRMDKREHGKENPNPHFVR